MIRAPPKSPHTDTPVPYTKLLRCDRDPGLDLTGDPERAQREYKWALDRRPGDPEILRRYAVSLCITGKGQDAEKLLDPLLRQSDKPAWRDRAFILAMNGRTKQAKDITQVTMPKGMADAIQPFMDRMPRLTAAQRAAAVHYGSFPSGAVQMAAAAPRTDTSAARGPDKALIPRGRALGPVAAAPAERNSNSRKPAMVQPTARKSPRLNSTPQLDRKSTRLNSSN